MTKTFLVLLAAAALALPSAAQVKIIPGPQKIHVEIDGKPFTDFYVAGDEVMKPYLHPLRTASGIYVTRMWPMEKVEEEAAIAKPDHPHQRGVWFAHDTVIAGDRKLDFWNNEASYKTPNRGKIVLAKLGKLSSGRKSGSITATFDWTDLEGHKVLTESRVMTFYNDPSLRIIDFDITLTPAEKVKFGDGKDGAFGIRMRPVLQETGGTGHIVNADGLEGEKQLWGKPSNWCDYSGEAEGQKVGIAILDNPENPHHPVRWHARGYGLFAANPFALKAFLPKSEAADPSVQDGSITVEAGQKLRFRYRVIVHPGDVKDADIAGQWTKYAGAKSGKPGTN
ncbi:MAG TPA: PmoA family protein [Bryobacteraceae bacterium]|nr:PmoA family protein [Bryobacteraceae bacterium]